LRLPRDLSGRALAGALAKLGYVVTRQTGSHIRMTRKVGAEHHVTVPDHDPIKVGTLNAILRDVAEKNDLTRDELLERLFGA
jgi:predicted RNA binding protein YcfA (HicA-like mRNA interferase family)